MQIICERVWCDIYVIYVIISIILLMVIQIVLWAGCLQFIASLSTVYIT
jgi:hypothetical protein